MDLGQIAREVAALLDHEARSQQVEIVLELAEDLPPVQGERVLLEQVVFNLARYALDTVRAQTGERRITLKTAFDAQLVYVEVCDTGPGVDPALGEHIFDSLVTGKQEGLGMGLTISRSIIEAHAGTLRYALNPEGGNTFMFSLAREAAVMNPYEPTVYIVDDDDAVREALGALLGSVCLRYESFASAEAFLAVANRQMRGCLLLDVRMPGMSGLELQRKLQDQGVGLQVIIITGHGDVPMAVRALKTGATDFIEKPFNEQDLLDRIQTCLKDDHHLVAHPTGAG